MASLRAREEDLKNIAETVQILGSRSLNEVASRSEFTLILTTSRSRLKARSST